MNLAGEAVEWRKRTCRVSEKGRASVALEERRRKVPGGEVRECSELLLFS